LWQKFGGAQTCALLLLAANVRTEKEIGFGRGSTRVAGRKRLRSQQRRRATHLYNSPKVAPDYELHVIVLQKLVIMEFPVQNFKKVCE
jgi:hypothetical protein